MHSSRLQRVRDALDDNQTIGTIRRIASAFTFNAPQEFFTSNIRAQNELEPHGCLGDLGWYCIRFALWVQRGKLPRRVTGRALSEFRPQKSKPPVPTEFSGELFLDDGVSSAFYCSFLSEIEQWASVSGTRGSLRIPDFVLPFSGSELLFETANPVYSICGCDFNLEPFNRRWTLPEHSHGHSDSQETNLFRQFTDQVRSGTLNSSWPDMALKTQLVMEACLKSARAHGQEIEVTPLE
jgi:Predicted dehydrogenases and related proteins